MRLYSLFPRLAMASLVGFLTTQAALAADFTFSGNFSTDDQAIFFRFNVTDATTPVSLVTTSFATGGFDPILSLFREADGSLIADNDDISFPDNRDARLSLNLDPGTYLVALTQSDNFATGPKLSSGFVRQGLGNFTGGPFLDPMDGQRTGSFGVSVGNVVTAAVAAPEPVSLSFVALGTLCLALNGRIRRRTAK